MAERGGTRPMCARPARCGRRAVACAGVVLVAFLLAGDSARAVRLVDARMGVHPGFTRVVLELDQPAEARIEELSLPDGGTELRVELEAASGARVLKIPNRWVDSVRVLPEPEHGRVMVRILLRPGGHTVRREVLDAPPRLVFDVGGPAPPSRPAPPAGEEAEVGARAAASARAPGPPAVRSTEEEEVLGTGESTAGMVSPSAESAGGPRDAPPAPAAPPGAVVGSPAGRRVSQAGHAVPAPAEEPGPVAPAVEPGAEPGVLEGTGDATEAPAPSPATGREVAPATTPGSTAPEVPDGAAAPGDKETAKEAAPPTGRVPGSGPEPAVEPHPTPEPAPPAGWASEDLPLLLLLLAIAVLVVAGFVRARARARARSGARPARAEAPPTADAGAGARPVAAPAAAPAGEEVLPPEPDVALPADVRPVGGQEVFEGAPAPEPVEPAREAAREGAPPPGAAVSGIGRGTPSPGRAGAEPAAGEAGVEGEGIMDQEERHAAGELRRAPGEAGPPSPMEEAGGRMPEAASLDPILQERIAELESRIAVLEDRLGAAERRLEGQRDENDRFRAQLAAHTDELRVQRTAIARTQRVVRRLLGRLQEAPPPSPPGSPGAS